MVKCKKCWKIWRALFSCYLRFEIRPFAISPTTPLFLYPSTTSETRRFSDTFRAYGKRWVTWNKVTKCVWRCLHSRAPQDCDRLCCGSIFTFVSFFSFSMKENVLVYNQSAGHFKQLKTRRKWLKAIQPKCRECSIRKLLFFVSS